MVWQFASFPIGSGTKYRVMSSDPAAVLLGHINLALLHIVHMLYLDNLQTRLYGKVRRLHEGFIERNMSRKNSFIAATVLLLPVDQEPMRAAGTAIAEREPIILHDV